MQTARRGSIPLAHLLLLTALIQVPGAQSVAVAAPIALCTLPVLLLSEAVVSKKVRLVVAGAAGCALLSGCLLAAVAWSRHEHVATTIEQIRVAGWFAGAALTAIAVAWSMDRVSPRRGMALLACGALVTASLTWRDTADPWKFSVGVPLTLVALVLVSSLGRQVSSVVLLTSSAISAVLDARSQIAFAAVALLGLFLPARLRAFSGRHPVLSIAGLTACLVALSNLLYQAMSQGYLGAAIAERTNRQAGAGTNPLLGARTEWAASWTLFTDRPFGYGMGVGVDPSLQNVAVAAAGALGGDTAGPYFSSVVFGGRVDLHSITVNSWFHFGLLGLACALVAAVVVIRAIYRLLVVRSAPLDAAMLFVMTAGLWHLLFSPSANAPEVAVALGLAVHVLATRRAASDDVDATVRRLPQAARTTRDPNPRVLRGVPR